MTRTTFLTAVALSVLFSARAHGSFFQEFGPETLVVIGREAGPEIRGLADKLAARLKENGNQREEIIITDSYADTKVSISGTNHLILVGTCADNGLLRKVWSNYALDRWEYHKSRPPLYEGQETEGFDVFGFGCFKDRDVGYVESGRNHYWIAAREKGKDHGYKTMVMITGAGPSGVAAAGAEFLRTGLLNGVVVNPASVTWKSGVFANGPERYVYDIPAWVPTAAVAKDGRKIACLGWSMPQSILYAGFLEMSGQKPLRMWRVKYYLDTGFADLESKLGPRFTGNELMVMEFIDETTARKALDGYQSSVLRAWEEAAPPNENATVLKSGDNYLVRRKSFVILETLPAGYDTLLMNELLRTSK